MKKYEDILKEIRDDLKKISSHKSKLQRSILADKLLIATGHYLQEIAKDKTQEKIAWEFSKLTDEIFRDLIEKNIEKFSKDRQIAYLIEALILCGSGSRLSTIEAVRTWLMLGKSTVRTAHEKIRSQEKSLFSIKDPKIFLKKTWRELDLDTLISENERQFSSDLGKINGAYKRLHKLYRECRPNPLKFTKQKKSA